MQIEIIDGKLYQWDTGRKVRLTPDADESITEVHFGCQRDPEALVVAPEIGEEIAVCIPPEPLQKSGWLQVYVMTATDTPGKRTAYHVAEPIFARPKPVDYVFTPTERLTWESLDKRVAALEAGGGGSGGGGDGDSGVLYVTLTPIPDTTFYTPSHTSAEIYAAHESGKYVYTRIEETVDGATSSIVLSLNICSDEMALFTAESALTADTTSILVLYDAAVYSYVSTEMKGATADQNGHQGAVPAPKAGQQDMVLHGDGTWRAVEGGGSGGGSGIVEIASAADVSAVSSFSYSQDIDGNPLKVNRFSIVLTAPNLSKNEQAWVVLTVNGKQLLRMVYYKNKKLNLHTVIHRDYCEHTLYLSQKEGLNGAYVGSNEQNWGTVRFLEEIDEDLTNVEKTISLTYNYGINDPAWGENAKLWIWGENV
jgi:hypothetical protein